MPEILNDTTFEVTLSGGDKVEIGDKESADFKPHIKLNRWDGECFIKIQPANLVEEEVEYEVEGDKVKCKYKVKQGEFEEEWETEFYPLESRTVIAKDKDGKDVEFTQHQLGGFEFEVILKKKPKTNKIVLDIETQELKFYYQPPLTQQEIDEGCIRPDNVVGSYAVLHATKRDHILGQTNYMCGIAFHIYRPKITDADGKWVWGELSLDGQAGTLTTTIPQEFLDTAVYPVSTGTTNFGYETDGASSVSLGKNIVGSIYGSGVDAGIAIEVTAYVGTLVGDISITCGIYETDYSLLAQTEEKTGLPSPAAWRVLEFAVSPEILASTDYWLAAYCNNAYFYYNAGAANQWRRDYKSPYNGILSDPWVPTNPEARQFSIYCTYEEEAAPEVEGGAQYTRVSNMGILVLRG